MTSHIDRRAILTGMATGTAAFAAMPALANAGEAAPVAANADDRSYALSLLERMACPVLSRMARGQLQAQWKPELSPT